MCGLVWFGLVGLGWVLEGVCVCGLEGLGMGMGMCVWVSGWVNSC